MVRATCQALLLVRQSRWQGTCMQASGQLVRYAVAAPTHAQDIQHASITAKRGPGDWAAEPALPKELVFCPFNNLGMQDKTGHMKQYARRQLDVLHKLPGAARLGN